MTDANIINFHGTDAMNRSKKFSKLALAGVLALTVGTGSAQALEVDYDKQNHFIWAGLSETDTKIASTLHVGVPMDFLYGDDMYVGNFIDPIVGEPEESAIFVMRQTDDNKIECGEETITVTPLYMRDTGAQEALDDAAGVGGTAIIGIGLTPWESIVPAAMEVYPEEGVDAEYPGVEGPYWVAPDEV